MINRPDKAKLYYPHMPATWWLRKRSYFMFMLREFTSVFIAIYLVVFLISLYRLGQSEAAYAAFMDGLRSPGWLAFHWVALLFAIYHSVTWFLSSAVVLSLRLGTWEAPRWLVAGAHIGGWLGVSLEILILYTVL
ncbi:MAG: hypothetical protein O7A08_10945 [SAR324 cluster bacterium]|nr:hypothetical protein [SAR324 cluster bacterium]